MTKIEINGEEYKIHRAQSDGRCFSAAVFYDLNGRVAEDSELNLWIQQYIIDPIIKTEDTDCKQFLLWAYKWAALHNNSTNFTAIKEKVIIPAELQDISFILDGLDETKKRLQSVIPPGDSKSSPTITHNYELNRIILSLDDIKALKKGLNNRGSYEFDGIIENIKMMLDDAKTVVENIPEVQTISRLKLLEINLPIIDFLKQTQEQICDDFRSKYKKQYELLVGQYKRYIELLNTPQQNSVGQIFYEWTEPNAGPIEILLKQPIISSINIYSTIDGKLTRFQGKSDTNTFISKYSLYLYYNGNHYDPLLSENPIVNFPPNSLLPKPKPKPAAAHVSVSGTAVSGFEDDNMVTPQIPYLKPLQSENLKPTKPRGKKSSSIHVTEPPITGPPVLNPFPPQNKTNLPISTDADPTPSAPPMEEHTTLSPVTQSEMTFETQENKKQEDKKTDDSKIPNSLIIYIKTRIPNFYKVTYEPYMSVPKSQSHTVYFDPLIKYYEAPIRNLPSGAPKDALMSQFFEAGEFDSMINRILSDFRYMQKKRTFQQAYDEHIIENNIRITLKNLFRTDNLFYINKKPYTIVSVKFNPSDWQIDKKPLEKLLNEFLHLSVKQIEDDAKKEEDDIPEILRQGNVASSNISESENVSVVASSLKNAVDNLDNTTFKQDISGITDAFIPIDELPGVSGNIMDLLSKYLRKNIPINYSNNIDLARDPLTLSLLVNKTDLLNFINKHKKSNLIDLYSAFNEIKLNLNNANQSYIDECIELGKYKKNFDERVLVIKKLLKSNTDLQNLISEITQLKIGYMQIIFRIADAINQIYQKQHLYFETTKKLLETLKVEYISIIQYYEKPVLALKCIEYDIVSISSLIEEDVSNPSSVSYFTNYKKFKQFYENQLYKNRQELLDPQINFAEEAEVYKNNPNFLLIEKEQYELYNFKMFLNYSYNHFDIWVNLFRSLEMFIRDYSFLIYAIINVSDNFKDDLNNKFTVEQQNNILKQIEAKGIMAKKNKSIAPYEQYVWYLVKSDGSNAIDTKNSKHVKFEKLYIAYIKQSVKAYDAIILYIYLLEILCSRQIRVYVEEENTNQLNLEFSLTLDLYYKLIIKNIHSGKQSKIPDSILWDTTNFNDIITVQKRQTQNNNQYIIFRARLKSINESKKNVVSYCQKIAEIITPNISKTEFINKCNDIITTQTTNMIPYNFKNSWWLKKTIENYDIQDTDNFIYNMNKVVKDAWYDRIIEDINVNSYLDWMVFNNNKKGIDSLYASVVDGLNAQLILTNSETKNPYTEDKNGKQIFTVNTIKQLVTDYNNVQDIPIDLTKIESVPDIIEILQITLKIKFIIFKMFELNLPINIGDIVLYKRHPYRLISKTKKDGKILYNLYNGYSEKPNIPQHRVKRNPNNFLNNFRIDCNIPNFSTNIVLTDYMYIVYTQTESDKGKIEKFKLVRDTNIPYIFTVDDIPIYIKYFIFNSCPDLDREILLKMGYKEQKLMGDILYFETQRRKHIESENISYDISKIEEKIKRYEYKYKQLKSIQKIDKSLEQQAEQLLYKEEIKDLKERKKILQEFLSESRISGGDPTLRPSEQYTSYSPQPLGYLSNPNMSRNVIYMPQQGYSYQYQNPYYTRQEIVPYNLSQNKAKDKKSKLSFYVTIELELFPGTFANMLQKSVVRCQSTFERIREAWADIFGVEYRPAPMTEAYAYNLQKLEDKKNKTEKKNISKNNKTRKTSK